jgi:hypothetical protein
MAKKKATASAASAIGSKRTLDDITAELPTKEDLSQLLRPLLPISRYTSTATFTHWPSPR